MEAKSLAPSWGQSCPYCGARNHKATIIPTSLQVIIIKCILLLECFACGETFQQPDGVLSCEEARKA